MIDYQMPTGKFYAMAEWAGKNVSDFYEYYYVPTEQVADNGQFYSTLLTTNPPWPGSTTLMAKP